MDYFGAFGYLFRGPRWGITLLAGSASMFVPIVGPIVFLGFLCECFDLFIKHPTAPPAEFDFGRIGEYLARGAWPFLASLLAGLVMILAAGIGTLPLLALPLFQLEAPWALLPIALTAVAWVAMTLVMVHAMPPITLASARCRALGPAFDAAFLRDFADRVGPEILLSNLVLLVAAPPLTVVGYACCLVGLYPAMTLLLVVQWHLMMQLYHLYLRRGGAAVGAKPGGVPDDWT